MSQHFFDLIRQGKTAEIAEAVEAQPTLARSRDAQGISAIILAIYTQQAVIRDFLLSYLTELDIFEAAAVGDCARLGHLIAADAMSVRAVSPDGWTPLHLAAAFANAEPVTLLLEHGAHVHQFSHNPLRNQPLHASVALHGSPDVVLALLEAGADVNATQHGGYTPLLQAAAAGKKDSQHGKHHSHGISRPHPPSRLMRSLRPKQSRGRNENAGCARGSHGAHRDAPRPSCHGWPTLASRVGRT